MISGTSHNRVHDPTLNLWALQRSRSISKSVELTAPPLREIVMPIPHYVSDLHDEDMLQYSTPTATHQSGRSIAPQNEFRGALYAVRNMRALGVRDGGFVRSSADRSSRRRGKAWLRITCRRVFSTDFTFATVLPAFGAC